MRLKYTEIVQRAADEIHEHLDACLSEKRSQFNEKQEMSLYLNCVDPKTAKEANSPEWDLASLLTMVAKSPKILGLKKSRKLTNAAYRAKEVRNRLSHKTKQFTITEAIAYLHDLESLCKIAGYSTIVIKINGFQQHLLDNLKNKQTKEKTEPKTSHHSEGNSASAGNPDSLKIKYLVKNTPRSISIKKQRVPRNKTARRSYGHRNYIEQEKSKKKPQDINIETLADQNNHQPALLYDEIDDSVLDTIQLLGYDIEDAFFTLNKFNHYKKNNPKESSEYDVRILLKGNTQYPQLTVSMLSIIHEVCNSEWIGHEIQFELSADMTSPIELYFRHDGNTRLMKISTKAAGQFDFQRDIESYYLKIKRELYKFA